MKIGGPGSPERPRGPEEAKAPSGKEAPPPDATADKSRAALDRRAETIARHDNLMGKQVAAAGKPEGKGGPDEARMTREAEAAYAASPAGSSRPEGKARVGELTRAISSAWREWQGKAALVDVKINGPNASGGRLEGPEIGPLIRAAVTEQVPSKVADAAARGVGEQWKSWQSSISVPGLPWYPGFAAVPGPQAERTANVPTPLTELQQDRSAMSSGSLLEGMTRETGIRDEGSLAILAGVAEGVEKAFSNWLENSMVTGVQGKGPVLAYAPPYVPVGPVVSGVSEASPGHIIT